VARFASRDLKNHRLPLPLWIPEIFAQLPDAAGLFTDVVSLLAADQSLNGFAQDLRRIYFLIQGDFLSLLRLLVK